MLFWLGIHKGCKLKKMFKVKDFFHFENKKFWTIVRVKSYSVKVTELKLWKIS